MKFRFYSEVPCWESLILSKSAKLLSIFSAVQFIVLIERSMFCECLGQTIVKVLLWPAQLSCVLFCIYDLQTYHLGKVCLKVPCKKVKSPWNFFLFLLIVQYLPGVLILKFSYLLHNSLLKGFVISGTTQINY